MRMALAICADAWISYLDPDNDWNALYYGSGANTRAIVLDRRFTNPGAEPIRQFMAKW